MPAYINTAHRFKTKMCKNWVEKGACPYEWRCCYAHGEHELRSKIQNATDGVGTNDAIRAWQRAKRPPPPAFPTGASTASATGKQHDVESSTDVDTPTTSTATATDVLKRSAPKLSPVAVAMPPPSTGAPCRAAYEVRVPCHVAAAPRSEVPTRWRREPYARRLCSLAIAMMQEQLRQQQQQQQQPASVKPQPRPSRASASSGSSATAAFVACASPTVTAFETVGSTGSECGSTPRLPCPRLAAPSWADASCSYLSEA